MLFLVCSVTVIDVVECLYKLVFLSAVELVMALFELLLSYSLNFFHRRHNSQQSGVRCGMIATPSAAWAAMEEQVEMLTKKWKNIEGILEQTVQQQSALTVWTGDSKY